MSSKRVLILLSLLVLNLAILAAGELNRQAGDRELASLAGSARQIHHDGSNFLPRRAPGRS
jgi:hypothetical protein